MDIRSARYSDTVPNSYGNANCDPDSYPNTNCNSYANCNGNSNVYSYSYGNRDADGNCYADTKRNANGNGNRYNYAIAQCNAYGQPFANCYPKTNADAERHPSTQNPANARTAALRFTFGEQFSQDVHSPCAAGKHLSHVQVSWLTRSTVDAKNEVALKTLERNSHGRGCVVSRKFLSPNSPQRVGLNV